MDNLVFNVSERNEKGKKHEWMDKFHVLFMGMN